MSSSIYTRGGDRGTTSLCDGTRVPKEAARIEAYGTVDEANSWVGAARAFAEDPLLDRVLGLVQQRLYNCSSCLAFPPGDDPAPVTISAEDVDFLERAVDRFERETGALDAFVVPGGSRASGLLHVARTVCRRAERRVWALSRGEPVDELTLKFLNRASDLLFAAARYAAKVGGEGDVHWDKDFPLPDID